MEQAEFLERLHEHGLARIAKPLMQAARPCIQILTEGSNDDAIPVGTSKFGGDPDLPMDFEWPKWNGEPLAFLAQIRLTALQTFSQHELLPSKGLLSFFYDRYQSTWGYDPKDRGSSRVVYHDSEKLSRTPPPTPAPEEAMFNSCSVSFEGSWTIPGRELLERAGLELTGEEQDGLLDLTDETLGHGHQLFGLAQEIQGEMAMECQMVSNGISCGEGDPLSTPEGKRLAAGAKDWRLLLQLDSDDSVGWLWGDCGRLYFWIREEDLKARRFENCWMILQCS